MKLERILMDVEVQHDFFGRSGSCFTKKASDVLRKIYALVAWARRERVPVISTVLRVRPFERGPLTDVPHCVDGTLGERKIGGTVLSSRINLGLRNTTDLPPEIFDEYQQVIFEKRDTDIFRHARAERLITELPPTTFVICGAGITHGIVEAAVGLRTRGFSVILATDAVYELPGENVKMAYLRMEAKGALLVPTSEIIAPKVLAESRPFRLPQTARK